MRIHKAVDKMFRLCVVVAILAASVNAIPIDNGVTGKYMQHAYDCSFANCSST
jgi:hypothetical protein